MARRKRKKSLFSNRGGSGRAWKRLLLWCGAVLAAVAVVAVVAWYQLLAYLQGDSFRRSLEGRMAEQLSAQRVSLRSALHIDGERVSEEGLSVENAGALASARAGRVSMELDRGALWERRLQLRKVSVEEAELVFADTESKPARKTKKKARRAAKKTKKDESSFFSLQGWGMELLECKDLDLSYRRKGETFRLQGCTLMTTPLKKGGWQYVAENGRLHTPYAVLDGASVRTATVQQDADGLSLTDCRIMLYPGEMRVRAGRDADGDKWSANIAVNKANLAPLLRGDWKLRVKGELFGKLALAGQGGELSTGEGSLSLQSGVLEGFPFLSELPERGGYPYRRLELEQAECRMTYPYHAPDLNIRDAWLFDHIDIRAKNGRLLVRGYVIVGEDGSLSGTLTMGLPKHAILNMKAAQNLMSLFNVQGGDEDYVWLNINLSGTVDEPEEDLSVRFEALVRDVLPQAAGQAAGSAEEMFRLLLQTGDTLVPTDGSGRIPAAPPLDHAVEGVRQGVQQGVDTVQQGIDGTLKILF